MAGAWASSAAASVKAKKTIVDLAALTLFWCFAVALVNPIGNFPLADDWAYGKTVQRLLDSGVYHPSEWDEATLVSHVCWGALFCLPFGFSFTALRFAVLTLGLAGILATYLLLKAFRIPRRPALMAALLLAVNPLYFFLSNSFMTDVSFFSMQLLAILFFVHTLKTGSGSALCAGTFFSVAAVLCRQLGIFVPVAFACTFPLALGCNARSLGKALVPVAVGLAAYCVFSAGMDYLHVKSPYFNMNIVGIFQRLKDPLGSLHAALNLTQRSSVYLGLFLLPLMVLPYGTISGSRSRVVRVSLWGATGLFIANEVYFMLNNRLIMPLMGNTISKYGLTLGIDYAGRGLPSGFWIVVTALGVGGGALLLFRLAPSITHMAHDLYRQETDRSDAAARLFLFLTGAMYYGVLTLVSPVRDRHLLVLIPILAVLVLDRRKEGPLPAQETPRLAVGRTVAAVALLVVYGGVCIGWTRDLFACNKVRWQLLNSLVNDSQVPPHHIAGGFEFDGWHYFDEKLPVGLDYLIAMSPMPGYSVFSESRFTRWILPETQSIFVLRRDGSAPMPTRDSFGELRAHFDARLKGMINREY